MHKSKSIYVEGKARFSLPVVHWDARNRYISSRINVILQKKIKFSGKMIRKKISNDVYIRLRTQFVAQTCTKSM